MEQRKRIAYVTGGMGGIGTAICERLHRDGHIVVAGCGPGSPRKQRWLAEMKERGFEIHASEGNVSDWDSTQAAFAKVRAEIASIIAWLASEDAGYATGADFSLNGGLHMH